MKNTIINYIREVIKGCIPPVLLRTFMQVGRRDIYHGNYPSWDAALKASTGYGSDNILSKVRNSLLMVKNGEKKYERDSVLFDQVQYSWPLLTGLLWAASRNGNRLNLIDFGGSLGSTYYQNLSFLGHLEELRWSIVEQPLFVECGKKDFEDNQLKFYFSLNSCLKQNEPNLILISSALQYLEHPYVTLEELFNLRFENIIIDRTPFLKKGNDRIVVQRVSREIYDASYPSWLFNAGKFLNFFENQYDLIAEFPSAFDAPTSLVCFKGYIFQRKPA